MHLLRTTIDTIQPQRLILGAIIAALLSRSLSLKAESINEPLTTPVENVEVMIDGAHKEASELLSVFALEIDNYFAEDIDVNKTNDTSATVRLEFSDSANDDFKIKGKLKLRLVLPRSQQRIRLLLDVDDEDNKSPTAEPLSSNDEEQALSLALRFIRKAREGTSLNLDVGARRHESKFQGFARLRASLESFNKESWSSKINNDLRLYHSSGYWNRLSVDFWHLTRPGSTTVLRTSSSIKWENTDPSARFDQTIGMYKELKGGALLAVELLAGYNTSPKADIENYYEGHQFRLRYRRNIFRPWFHFEVWPSISWLTNNDSDPKLGGLIRTEVRFGKY